MTIDDVLQAWRGWATGTAHLSNDEAAVLVAGVEQLRAEVERLQAALNKAEAAEDLRNLCSDLAKEADDAQLQIRELTKAVENIVNVLGPQGLACGQNTCAGCRYEMGEALRVAKTALQD